MTGAVDEGSGDALRAAHECGDLAGMAMAYLAAARDADAVGDEERSGFFLTQALVLALEAGLPEVQGIVARLRLMGREDDAANSEELGCISGTAKSPEGVARGPA